MISDNGSVAAFSVGMRLCGSRSLPPGGCCKIIARIHIGNVKRHFLYNCGGALWLADSLIPDTPNICCITVVVPNGYLDPHIDSIFLWEYSPPLDISRLSPNTRFDTNSVAWLSNKSKPEARELGTWKAKLSDTVAISITNRDQETNSLSMIALSE